MSYLKILELCFIIFILSLLFLPAVVKADLPRVYQSDDVDKSGNTSSADLNIIAEYVDFVFPVPPPEIAEQNRKFIDNFPSTNDLVSAVPEGVETESRGVIKDAYVLLVPVKGFVKLPDGEYLADKTGVVGYVCDYRVQLPPDKTDSYPKHYYYIQNSDVKVTVESKDVKTSNSKKDIFTLAVEGDIKVVAEIKVVVKEVVEELHTSCSTTCDDEGNCETHCHSYVVTYTNYHTYTLTVKDTIHVKGPDVSKIYSLIRDGEPVEHWIFPSEDVAYIADDNGKPIVTELMCYTTYKVVKEYTKHETVGKSGSAKISTAYLAEPCYTTIALPSYGISIPRGLVKQTDMKNETVSLSNFKPYLQSYCQPKRVEAVRLVFTGNITVCDPFGNELPCSRAVRVITTPVVEVAKECNDTSCSVTMRVFGESGDKTDKKIPYTGQACVSWGAKTETFNVTDGVLTFTVKRGYVVNYHLFPVLPDRWYSYDGPFFTEKYGSFETGPSSYMLSWYEFGILLAGAVPLIAMYCVYRWVFSGDEEEYI